MGTWQWGLLKIKENIMDKEIKTCAIAIHAAANGDWYWAQEFGY